MTDKLKECPFCGSARIEGVTSSDENRLFREFVCCADCGASTTTHETKQEAVNAWNTRYKRTCHTIIEDEIPVCSECGEDIDPSWAACPYCGAEVVDG